MTIKVQIPKFTTFAFDFQSDLMAWTIVICIPSIKSDSFASQGHWGWVNEAALKQAATGGWFQRDLSNLRLNNSYSKLFFHGQTACFSIEYRKTKRIEGHKFTSFCDYSVLPSLNKVYYYYCYYYYYYYYYYYLTMLWSAGMGADHSEAQWD